VQKSEGIMRSITPSRWQSGFTLIELMVVLAVMVVLAIIAVPSFIDYMARTRLRTAADGVAGQLALARAEAMRRNRNVIVTFTTSSGAWCSGGNQAVLSDESTEGISFAGAAAVACDCTSPTTCLINGDQSVVSSTDNSTVELISGGSVPFQFDRTVGAISNLTGDTIVFRSKTRPNRYELGVVVSPLGHARVCVPSGFASFGGYKACP
jgi:type IV fimbrial biogenesis protein FimT